jgi:signal transduction histidine kinase
VALWVALPMLVALASLSLMHYWRERHLAEDQARLTVIQLGQVMTGSLRHTMLVNDREMLTKMLSDIGAMDTIERVQILDLSGEVKVSSAPAEIGQVWRMENPGCNECHQFPPEERPRTVLLSSETGSLRIASPIANEPECTTCHAQGTAHLGILLADVTILAMQQHLIQDLRADLSISTAITLLVTVGVYLLVHWLVVRRVEAFRRPLAEYAAGNFASRLPPIADADELDALAGAFNRMADELERHVREERERSELRQRAIVEERERIARELHDGLAQLLGYVNTKAMAVRLMLKRRQMKAADEHLLQLEEAARELFVDVREAILGLRASGQAGIGLAAMLNDYAAQFSRLSNLPIRVEITPEVESLHLAAEAELQLLRIVQEALTNIRKHATATEARVRVQRNNGTLELMVSDNGQGFDPERAATDDAHFGLETMRERAEAIGAELELDSQPGAGTCVVVRLPVGGELGGTLGTA